MIQVRTEWINDIEFTWENMMPALVGQLIVIGLAALVLYKLR